MIISALKEPGYETRVAITPSSIKQFTQLGFKTNIEQGAGLKAGFSDQAYEEAGATIINNRKNLLEHSSTILLISQPELTTVENVAANTLLIGPFDTDPESKLIELCRKKNISLLSMNLIPRISRAQSMDSLSSQANLAGYRAVLEACSHFQRAIPMMMTAAGMIHPAKVLILGAGVAGLQAIATAKRLGAVVYAFDVRTAAKEQVESLGAEFIEVEINEDTETEGGYAKETSEDYQKRQNALIDEYAQKSDIIITTALIPGRKAPVLLFKNTIEKMKPGSIVVDMATSRGGNCEASVADKVTIHNEVTIVGYSNLAGFIPTTASELYANNFIHLLKLLVADSATIQFNPDDEIVKQSLLCHNGQYMPFANAKEKENE